MRYMKHSIAGTLCYILLLAVVIAGCAPAAQPAAPAAEPAAEAKATEAPAAEAAPAAPADESNPYRPNSLFEAIDALKAATAGKSAPDGAKYAYMTNNTSPFWTAAQAGVEAASKDLGVPIVFQSPTGSDLLSQQLSMLETLVNDGYTGITFSSIDRQAPKSIIERAVGQGINVLTMDSDATGSQRSMYIGMSDYDAGRAAGEAALEIIGKGKVVGLVGFATAQNAQDRIAGVNDVLKGTELEMVEVLLDDVKPEVALSNAQTAIQKYGDELAGFITFYSYDGPAACQAVKQADKIGTLKIVAFDAEPETQTCTQEGVIQAMIGQRVFFYGYLSGYVMHAMSIIGPEETMKVLDPYLDDLGDEGKIRLNTGVDVIKAETLDQYKEYLSSIGIKSQ